jgi:glycosyltransferase involved in cell wall biosynthesis
MGQQLLAVRLAGSAAFCITERNQYILTGWERLRRVVQFHILRILGAHYSANSKAVALHLAKQVRTAVSSLPILPNGAPLIPSDQHIRDRFRTLLNWEKNDIGIGYVARMATHKGHHTFLKVLQNLLSAKLRVKACLVGDGPHRSQVETLIRELDLEDAVTLVGVVSNVEDYLQAFDILALFSEHEGMPNAVLEAMAAGKSIVATGAGAIPELLDDGRAGWVVAEATIEAMTSALRSLVEDETLRQDMGQSAAERVEKFFSLEKSFDKLLQYYRRIK